MTRDESCLRDRTHMLFQACRSAVGDSDQDGSSPSHRHLSIAALNLASEFDPAELIEAGRILPWLAVYMHWDGDASIDEVAGFIYSNKLVHHLNPEILRRRLVRGMKRKEPTIRRVPDGAQPTPDDPRHEILANLCHCDDSIDALLALSDNERRDLLIGDSELLATTLEICADRSQTSHSLSTILPTWDILQPALALEILARFEKTNFCDIPREFSHLDERSRRFEQSLAEHLQSHGVVCAIRAALAISPAPHCPPPNTREIRGFLTDFSPFAEDPSLQDLAIALIQCRHLAQSHLSGAAPLAALQPWITYLRGPCAEFAESRGITLREATNFAHYSFHLLNLCDLAAREDVELHEPLRRTLMDLEEELKEFALVGQREGFTDLQSDLQRFEQTKWRNETPRALLLSRIQKIGGAWRRGLVDTSPGNLDLNLDVSSSELDAAAHLIRHARLQNHEWLASWDPSHILSLVILGLCAARNSDDVDTNAPFTVDFQLLKTWLHAQSTQQRISTLHTLLDQRSLSDLIASPSLPSTGGLTAECRAQRVNLEFRSHPEMEALLTLLANCEQDDPLTEPLRKRLTAMQETAPIRVCPQPDRSSHHHDTVSELSG